jgi:hypothetical protein
MFDGSSTAPKRVPETAATHVAVLWLRQDGRTASGSHASERCAPLLAQARTSLGALIVTRLREHQVLAGGAPLVGRRRSPAELARLLEQGRVPGMGPAGGLGWCWCGAMLGFACRAASFKNVMTTRESRLLQAGADFACSMQ